MFFNKSKTEKEKISKILVIRYKTIGDTVFSLPFYRELRKNYGQNCQIDAISSKSYKVILEKCPYIDNIFCEDEIGRIHLKNIKKIMDFLSQYDKIYFLTNTRTLTILSFFAGIKNRVGIRFPKNKLITKGIEYDTSIHAVDLYLRVLKEEGLNVEDNSYQNTVNFSSKNAAARLMNNISDKYVTIQAFASSIYKNWNKQGWKRVIDYITQELNYDVVLLGGKSDFSAYEKIGYENKNVHNLSGKCSLEDSIYYIKNSLMHIGIDSGLIHIASLFEKDSILLHGSTSMVHWRPLNKNCRIISKNYSCSPCIHHMIKKKTCTCTDSAKCMDAISADEVIGQISNIINQS